MARHIAVPDDTSETPETLAAGDAAADASVTRETWANDEVGLAETLIPRQGLPVFEGVKVIYIGPKRRMALALKGVVYREVHGEHVVKTIGRTARRFSNYVFWRVDEANQPVSTRLMPEAHRDSALRGHPFCVVEHPEHLYYFARRPEEFRFQGPAPVMRALEEYIAKRERMRRGYQAFEDRVTA